MRKLIGICTALLLVMTSAGSALALDVPFVNLRVGARGGPSISIISGVAEEDPEPVYPGFFGVGWAVGGGLSFDYLSIVGLTIEFIYSRDTVTGSVEFDEDLGEDRKKETSDFTLEATQMHIPIYVQAQVPTGVARPFLNVGVDIAFNRSDHAMNVDRRGDAPAYDGVCNPGVDCDPFPNALYDVDEVDSQIFLLVGLGLDIEFEPIDVPIEFRALINPGMSDSVDDRTTTRNREPNFLYRNEWEYQIQILFGLNYRIL